MRNIDCAEWTPLKDGENRLVKNCVTCGSDCEFRCIDVPPDKPKRKSRSKYHAGAAIEDLNELMAVAESAGGVYHAGIGRFLNVSWVYAQQFKYLRDQLRSKHLCYPLRNQPKT